ncbi:unnamed protein product, partial [Mesorhabditis belari]|uniref:Uncharacterized protein n=1 Tax=Mesorhabditis belari TaxID=2138241 RepID=A0AAF3J3U2_9BILA
MELDNSLLSDEPTNKKFIEKGKCDSLPLFIFASLLIFFGIALGFVIINWDFDKSPRRYLETSTEENAPLNVCRKQLENLQEKLNDKTFQLEHRKEDIDRIQIEAETLKQRLSKLEEEKLALREEIELKKLQAENPFDSHQLNISLLAKSPHERHEFINEKEKKCSTPLLSIVILVIFSAIVMVIIFLRWDLNNYHPKRSDSKTCNQNDMLKAWRIEVDHLQEELREKTSLLELQEFMRKDDIDRLQSEAIVLKQRLSDCQRDEQKLPESRKLKELQEGIQLVERLIEIQKNQSDEYRLEKLLSMAKKPFNSQQVDKSLLSIPNKPINRDAIKKEKWHSKPLFIFTSMLIFVGIVLGIIMINWDFDKSRSRTRRNLETCNDQNATLTICRKQLDHLQEKLREKTNLEVQRKDEIDRLHVEAVVLKQRLSECQEEKLALREEIELKKLKAALDVVDKLIESIKNQTGSHQLGVKYHHREFSFNYNSSPKVSNKFSSISAMFLLILVQATF